MNENKNVHYTLNGSYKLYMSKQEEGRESDTYCLQKIRGII